MSNDNMLEKIICLDEYKRGVKEGRKQGALEELKIILNQIKQIEKTFRQKTETSIDLEFFVKNRIRKLEGGVEK